MSTSIDWLIVGFLFLWAAGSLCVVFLTGRRRKAAVVATIGLVGTLAAAAVGVNLDDKAARAQGYASINDRRSAEKHGFADPQHWAQQRDVVLAAEAANEIAKRDKEWARNKAIENAELLPAEQGLVAEAAAKVKACRNDLRCSGEKALVVAGFRCKPGVENLAKFDVEWTDGFLGQKFDRFRWLDDASGTVTAVGDQVVFGNAFGGQVPMIYECDVDPETRKVLAVRVFPGRLPANPHIRLDSAIGAGMLSRDDFPILESRQRGRAIHFLGSRVFGKPEAFTRRRWSCGCWAISSLWTTQCTSACLGLQHRSIRRQRR